MINFNQNNNNKQMKTYSSKYSGYIGAVTVRALHKYIVYGSVRGLISQHRTQSGAVRSAQADRRCCRRIPGDNAYSDVEVYFHNGDGWEIVVD